MEWVVAHQWILSILDTVIREGFFLSLDLEDANHVPSFSQCKYGGNDRNSKGYKIDICLLCLRDRKEAVSLAAVSEGRVADEDTALMGRVHM